jgi:hypothetical protein
MRSSKLQIKVRQPLGNEVKGSDRMRNEGGENVVLDPKWMDQPRGEDAKAS